MRVLVISQYFPPDMGGGATRAYNVAKGLLLNNCEVKVIAAFPHYPDGNIPEVYRWKALRIEKVEGIDVIRTFMPPLASQGIAKRLILFISFLISSLFALPLVNDFDIIWAANPNILSMFPAMIYGRLKRCPIALNVDDLWTGSIFNRRENSLMVRMIAFLSRLVYSKANMITPISPGYVGVIHENFNVSLEKIRVIRGGVDLSKFGENHTLSNNCKKNFRLLYVGAFSVAYNFNQVLLAAKILEEEGIDFVMQGRGELIDYVKSRAKELKLKNLKIIDKIVCRDEVAKFLNTADALILPLRNFDRPYLGISTKLYEYQAVGKPILCCAEGQPAKYVMETESGIVVKPGDYGALSKAVLYLRENRDVAEKLGASGRKYVENNLSIEKIGLKMMTVFKKVCTPR